METNDSTNIVDFKELKPVPYNGGELKLLYIGRCVPQKNIFLLLDILLLVNRKIKGFSVSLTFIGDGPERGKFESEIKKRGLTDKIKVIPSASRDAIVTCFATHHLLILTSLYEGFPRVFMEAGASGTPIITTRVGGVRNVIDEDSEMPGGIVLDTKVVAFVSVLRALIAHPEKVEEMGQAIQDSFWDRYNENTTEESQKVVLNYLSNKTS